MIEFVFILASCNINAILYLTNNIRKKLAMITIYYGNQIATDQSTISIKISNIDSNH